MTQTVSGSRGWATIGKPNSLGSPARDLLPGPAAVERAVLAAVVLLVEPLRVAGGHDQLVDALAGLGGGSGRKSARTPWLRGSQVAPPSRVSKVPTAEIADPHPLPGSVGWGTIVWRMRPPAPGCQVGRLGWFVRPSTWAQVRPPSSLRNSPAGPTPA